MRARQVSLQKWWLRSPPSQTSRSRRVWPRQLTVPVGVCLLPLLVSQNAPFTCTTGLLVSQNTLWYALVAPCLSALYTRVFVCALTEKNRDSHSSRGSSSDTPATIMAIVKVVMLELHVEVWCDCFHILLESFCLVQSARLLIPISSRVHTAGPEEPNGIETSHEDEQAGGTSPSGQGKVEAGPPPKGGRPGDWVCPRKDCADLVFGYVPATLSSLLSKPKNIVVGCCLITGLGWVAHAITSNRARKHTHTNRAHALFVRVNKGTARHAICVTRPSQAIGHRSLPLWVASLATGSAPTQSAATSSSRGGTSATNAALSNRLKQARCQGK